MLIYYQLLGAPEILILLVLEKKELACFATLAHKLDWLNWQADHFKANFNEDNLTDRPSLFSSQNFKSYAQEKNVQKENKRRPIHFDTT